MTSTVAVGMETQHYLLVINFGKYLFLNIANHQIIEPIIPYLVSGAAKLGPAPGGCLVPSGTFPSPFSSRNSLYFTKTTET